MNENGKMNAKEAETSAKDLAKWVKEEAKKSKEYLDLVCYLRVLLDKCTYGNGDQIDFGHKKLVRSNDIMMKVQHEKDMAKEKRMQEKEQTTLEGGW